MNNYIYIAVMALVSYAIRILPLTLIRKPIKNRFIQSFFVLCALCDAGGHDLPGHHPRNPDADLGCGCSGGRYHRSMVRCGAVPGVGHLLRAGVCH